MSLDDRDDGSLLDSRRSLKTVGVDSSEELGLKVHVVEAMVDESKSLLGQKRIGLCRDGYGHEASRSNEEASSYLSTLRERETLAKPVSIQLVGQTRHESKEVMYVHLVPL